MARRSAFARFLALFVALALAGSQAAMASFAPPAALPAMQQVMAATDDCHQEAAAKHICQKTCQDEPQKNEVPGLAALPPPDGAFLRVALAFPARGNAVPLQAVPARATSPPPLVLFAHYLK